MNVLKSFENWRSYRNTVAVLKNLSDRELADFGLSRGEIHNAARRATRG